MKVVRVGVSVIVYRYIEDVPHVLMGKRKGSHGAGTWSFPGGHLEYGETAIDCAFRELEEEVGITKDMMVGLTRGPYVEDFFAEEQKHYITLMFTGTISTLVEPITVQLKEPDKCELWTWVKRGKYQGGNNNLPSPLFPPVQNFINSGHKIFQ